MADKEVSPARRDISRLQETKVEEIVESLESNMEEGLRSSEVKVRLKQYGYNEVPEKRGNPLVAFAKKFWGLTAWMLEAIVVLSWILRRYSDFYIVSALLVLNSVIGFAQEQRASGAVDALKKRLRVNARVFRDRVWKAVPAVELVPGDVVRLRTGDFVPADVKIATGELGVDQSALTGESMEATKRSDDMLYSGSIVRRGEANGIVVLTGVRTYFGRTTELVQLARPDLHIEEVISKVVKWLLLIVIASLSMALAFSAAKSMNLLEILPLMLVLLLSAIPVALPVMFTVSMAVGSMELAKRGVLVTRLSASEDAATMDIVCIDKTGTITMNKLSIAKITPLYGFSERDVILFGALASNEANQDPIDLAFIDAANQRNMVDGSYIQESFIPFDPSTRRTESIIQKGGQEFRVAKGAVGAIAEYCGLDERTIRQLEVGMAGFAEKGYRTLAVAKTDERNQPQLVGLVALYDMPRPDSKQLINELRELGVSVKMLTGDALPIARETAREVELGENVMKASDLRGLAENSAKAARLLEEVDGLAEIYPEDKYTVVKHLQARGHIVGMTGDGVNDAPALKQAEVGIAVSNATDVAKGAASVVLTSEGLPNIADLIMIGRTIYERIITWILNKISRTILKSSFIVLPFLITGRYVISAFAMILIVFMTDFVKISLSTDNVRWSEKPNTWNIVAPVKIAIILGLLMVGESCGLLYIGLEYFGLLSDDPALYTFSFQILFYFAVFSIFVVRERQHFWSSKPSKILVGAIAADMAIAAVISTVGIPGLAGLPLTVTLFTVVYAFFFSLVVNDLVKFNLLKKTGITW